MNKWTFTSDRLPAEEDASPDGNVLDGSYCLQHWSSIVEDEPWYPLPRHEKTQHERIQALLSALDRWDKDYEDEDGWNHIMKLRREIDG
jgi:hypothetical protein